MNSDNKNLYLAIALSVLVIIGWNYFYGWPQMQRARQAQIQAQTVENRVPPPTGVTGAASPAITNGRSFPPHPIPPVRSLHAPARLRWRMRRACRSTPAALQARWR